MSNPVSDIVRGDILHMLSMDRNSSMTHVQFNVYRIHLRNRVASIFHGLFEGIFQ